MFFAFSLPDADIAATTPPFSLFYAAAFRYFAAAMFSLYAAMLLPLLTLLAIFAIKA